MKITKCFIVGLLLSTLILCGPTKVAAQDEVFDPLEGVNRRVFWFNEKVDKYFLSPISEGYDFVMPKRAQRGVRNFFDNLSYPKYST